MFASISAFWHNDTDHGIGLTVKPTDPGGNVDDVAEMIIEALKFYRDTDADPNAMLADLPDYAVQARDGELTETDRLTILTYIAYLQEIGGIPCDEYNGMVYAQVMPPPTLH